MARIGVVIPAAGQGRRMGAGFNKQFLLLREHPLLAYTIHTFQESDRIQEIVVVGAEADRPGIQEIIKNYHFTKVSVVPIGGATRQESVLAGVQALSTGTEKVVVHDGARPLLTLKLLHRFLEEAEGCVAAITGVALKDTVKKINSAGEVLETPNRDFLRAIQTPQFFDKKLLEKAHKEALQKGFAGTDDASLIEWLGFSVQVLEGSVENIKITTPEDLWLAERILNQRNTT